MVAYLQRMFLSGLLLLSLAACDRHAAKQNTSDAEPLQQTEQALIAGEVMAVAYSGYRQGQHPASVDPAGHPSDEQIMEDLKILVENDFKLIRMYGTGDYTARSLRLIRQHRLPIKMLLGIWLRAEISNHEGCPWLDEPIPEAELTQNRLANAAEVQQGIALAREYSDIVVAINVGNEALVSWNDHMVPVERVIEYVRQVKAATSQAITVAENYVWWREEGAALAAELDFIAVHSYPQWEGKHIDEALSYTVENLLDVAKALPDKPLAILEAGWATTAIEFGDRASEAAQLEYYQQLQAWAKQKNITVFFFEAFDEPWKGDPAVPQGAEKHWGLYKLDRSPKLIMQ